VSIESDVFNGSHWRAMSNLVAQKTEVVNLYPGLVIGRTSSNKRKQTAAYFAMVWSRGNMMLPRTSRSAYARYAREHHGSRDVTHIIFPSRGRGPGLFFHQAMMFVNHV
jgi:hypothetical protein